MPPHKAPRISPMVARVAAANRAATLEPQAQGFVNAVQVFPFSDGTIYQVYTAPGAVTDIALQPGENLVAVAAGDTVRWVIGDTTSGIGAEKRTHILVKPFASGLATNLVVTTERRSYAILQLLAVYGLRSGEIRHLRIEDIDWRTEAIHVRHHKTRASTFLPLLEPVGEAVLAYLRSGRPSTDAREIFVRTRAPYRKLYKLYSMVRRRLRDAGVQPPGKCGPHIFRHARAVEMLRAAVPQKIIGDVLGHRSTGSTAPYLKLATEDLRAIALDVPGMELVA